ncbi:MULTISPECIES: hypothetical protein [Okeania]|nr:MULTISPECIES: hypothetical protein [Okeania]NET13187.1 hypothetical protein [Okeania sp. SIO1H6]NES79612.1 hypothetical protein [Okeania sp. SIO1H4]NES92478.1 hypothetical protein [Okeania sp. SIO2B9]NET23273.1 hypothetical protein [Okeania sp. SIO1H5]NET76619.1 hypothetical protein [Okeania sp. SIO1F9]
MTSNHNYTRIIHPDTLIIDYSAGLLMRLGNYSLIQSYLVLVKDGQII